ncbi:MAG TPA: ribosome small subunit-dependent GTPase A [Steroidobacteraceae bacterium]
MSAPFATAPPDIAAAPAPGAAGAPAAGATGVRPVLRARVIAAHGRQLRVRLAAGEETMARSPGRDCQVVCGDLVRCEFDARHAELRVVALEPRTGVLFRSNARGVGEPIAANLSLLLVVVAPAPKPDFYIVDRYLAAAQCAGIRAGVLLNKAELDTEPAIERELLDYGRLGLEPLRVSALTAPGVTGLQARLRGETAVLVGQSGVGKSSLLRALVPESAAAVGALLRDDEGRHTTTATHLYALPGGGAVIDSPGVRDFAPAMDRLSAPALGFTEIAALSAGCRFGNCLHLREPDCAVRNGVGGAVSARRYESYRRLRRLSDRLRTPRGPGVPSYRR